MKDRLKNNLGLKLMSLLFAIVLWIVVVNIDNPVDEQVYRVIPVRVLHEEIFTSKASTYSIVEGEAVNVTIRAKRKVLSQITAQNIIVTADIKDRIMNSPTEATLPTQVTVRGFENEIEEAYTNPRNLEIRIEPSVQQVFTVSVETVGSPRTGYVIGSKKANPETIRLGGGASQIKKIKRVVAKAVVSGISESTSVDAELLLYDENDVQINQALFSNNLGKEGMKVDVEVLKTKNVPLEFETNGIIPADGHTIGQVTCEPETISVAGTIEDLNAISKIRIPAEALEADGISKSKEIQLDVSKYLPERIILEDDTVRTVVVTIPVERYGTKVFNIPSNSIIIENVVSGLKPKIATLENIEIRIKGSKQALEKVIETPEVFVNLEKYTNPGTISVPVEVKVPEGCSLSGAPTVQITLEEIEEG